MELTRIIIADDHEFFRKGLVAVLEDIEFVEVVGQAENGKVLLERLSEVIPDIIITDIKMPELNGIEAVKEIRKKYPKIKILVLSMFGEEQYLEKMLQLGVQGFLLKNTNTEILEKTLNTISSGGQYFSEEFIPYFTRKYLSKDDDSSRIKLTPRETEVLQLIASGLTNREIAEKLFISIKTVTNHRTNIIEKTGSKNTASLLAFAFKNKLVDFDS